MALLPRTTSEEKTAAEWVAVRLTSSIYVRVETFKQLVRMNQTGDLNIYQLVTSSMWQSKQQISKWYYTVLGTLNEGRTIGSLGLSVFPGRNHDQAYIVPPSGLISVLAIAELESHSAGVRPATALDLLADTAVSLIEE